MRNRAQLLLMSKTRTTEELVEILNEFVDEYDSVDLISDVDIYIVDMDPEE